MTVDKIQAETTLSKHRQTKAINKLKEAGLIETDLRGMPAKRHFRFPEDFSNKLANFLTTGWSISRQQVGQNFNANENTTNENTTNNSIKGGEKEANRPTTEDTPPSSGQPPQGLPKQELAILEALEKAKAFFEGFPDMKKYMLDRAKVTPEQVDIEFELEQWIRHNSENLILMQDPAAKINSNFQRWLSRADRYSGKGKRKQSPRNGRDTLQKDRQHYSQPGQDQETW